mmetsp:Transcript_20962/g.35370  ORF Transcript_20962/g.35370 Transcript_20962/m.35370 type:complete len:274 (-) Transcript_20962:1836-2657(-)
MKSVMIDKQDIRNYNWGECLPPHTVQYSDVINFDRASNKQNRCCVLCGDKEDEKDRMIPKQNKGVCRRCDSTYWLLKKLGVVVKFCKGCKLFFSLVDFDGKPNTTKCGTCRRRGRDNYHGKMVRKRCLKYAESEATIDNEVDGGCTSGSSSGCDSDDMDEAAPKVMKKKMRRTRDTISAPPLPVTQVGAQSLGEMESEDGVVALLLGMDSLRSRERLASSPELTVRVTPPLAPPMTVSKFEQKGKEDGDAMGLLLAAATMKMHRENDSGEFGS